MDWSQFITVIAMALILEGLMPFILPKQWREIVLEIATQSDSRIRFYGAIMMIVGAIALVMIRG